MLIRFISMSLFLFVLISCSNRSISPKTNTGDSDPMPAELLGTWTHQKTICDTNDIESTTDYTITIDKQTIRLASNKVDCNGCHKRYKLAGDKIIFPDRFSSAICTELYCLPNYRYCENESNFTDLFVDMKFKLNGDKLTLSREGERITLTRKVADD